MMNVFKSSGFEKHRVWSSDTVHFELPVNGAAALWEKADLREKIAVANSLSSITAAKSYCSGWCFKRFFINWKYDLSEIFWRQILMERSIR